MPMASNVRVLRGRTVTFIVRGEAAFLFFVGVCVALHPGFVLKRNEGGMSNYGLHLKTAVPYTLALGLLALCSVRAASLLDRSEERSRRLWLVLTCYSAILLLVLVSSYFYSLDTGLKDTHFVFGTALIVFAGTASLWMLRVGRPSALDWISLCVQLLGDVLALLSAVGAVHLLFLAEMLANLGLASLLVRTSRRVAESGPGDEPSRAPTGRPAP